jgi:UDP-sugar transporter A1/2/3
LNLTRYADNILRTFAQTVAVLFGAFGSYFLFDFQITTSFNVHSCASCLLC